MNTLIEHLKSIGYNKNIARLCFYNYLTYFHNKDIDLSPDQTVQEFVKKILFFQYWQERFNLMIATLESDLQSFYPHFERSIKQFKNIEILAIKNKNNFYHLCKKYSEHKHSENNQIRKTQFKLLNSKMALLIHECKIGGAIVETLPNIGMIDYANIKPIGAVSTLSYNSYSQLTTEKVNCLQINPSQQLIFKVNPQNTVDGVVLSGHVLNKVQCIKNKPLHAIQECQVALKGIEKHYFKNYHSTTTYNTPYVHA